MMVKKIISGGQTGADRAALDVAIKFEVIHGGWVPKDRKTEDGTLPLRYKMDEMPTDDYRERTRQNIQVSHGTLLISYGELTGGSKLTKSFAKVLGKPICYVDLMNTEAFEAAMISKSFITENQIQILNVAGPRISHFPGIYQDVKTILETILYLLFLDSDKEILFRKYVPTESIREDFPERVKDAVELLKEDLSLKSRAFVAKIKTSEISMLYFVMLDYLRKRCGLDARNIPLLAQCRQMLDDETATVEDAVMLILKRLKNTLETDHVLRVVK